MTDEAKIVLVRNMTDEADTDIISAYLDLAGDAVYHAADPYKTMDKAALLEEYGGVQAKAAAYYINKRGADGERTHNENGINRGYENADLPDSLLREITPIAGVAR